MTNETTRCWMLIVAVLVGANPVAAAPLFRPASPQWGQAFAGVSRFLATDAGAALAARHPFVGALKGLDAAPGNLEALAPMAERIAEGNPSFHQHMARVESLSADQQKQVLAVVAYAHEKGAKEVEARIDAEIARYRATGDVEGLRRLAAEAPAYAVYGDAVHMSHVRAFVMADGAARALNEDKKDGLAGPGQTAVLGGFSRSGAALEKHTQTVKVNSAPVEAAGSAVNLSREGSGLAALIGLGLFTGAWGLLAAHLFAGGVSGLGAFAALVALLSGAALMAGAGHDGGERPHPATEDYYTEREDRRLDAKSVEDAARRLRGPDPW